MRAVGRKRRRSDHGDSVVSRTTRARHGVTETASPAVAPQPDEHSSPPTDRWDTSKPANWTHTKLRAALEDIGIVVPITIPKKTLLQLYSANIKQVSNATSSNTGSGESLLDAVVRDLPLQAPVPGPSNLAPMQVRAQPECTSVLSGSQRDPNFTSPSSTTVRAQPEAATQVDNNNMAATVANDVRFSHLATQINSLQQSMDTIASKVGCSTSLDNRASQPDQIAVAASNLTARTLAQVMPQHATNSVIFGTANVLGVALDSLPSMDTVTPSLRKAIQEGKDINFNSFFINGHEFGEVRSVELGGDVVRLKNSDARMSKNLGMDQFIIAFGIYSRIMCEAFPSRLAELNAYLQFLIEINNSYPGQAFYTYHKYFAAQSYAALQKGIRIDWSIPNQGLYTKVVGGLKADSCKICYSIMHKTPFCPQNMDRANVRSSVNRPTLATDTKPPSIYHHGHEICNNFNGAKGCFRITCHRAHVCSTCFGVHSAAAHTTNLESPGGHTQAKTAHAQKLAITNHQ
jgi:hypothetical protein